MAGWLKGFLVQINENEPWTVSQLHKGISDLYVRSGFYIYELQQGDRESDRLQREFLSLRSLMNRIEDSEEAFFHFRRARLRIAEATKEKPIVSVVIWDEETSKAPSYHDVAFTASSGFIYSLEENFDPGHDGAFYRDHPASEFYPPVLNFNSEELPDFAEEWNRKAFREVRSISMNLQVEFAAVPEVTANGPLLTPQPTSEPQPSQEPLVVRRRYKPPACPECESEDTSVSSPRKKGFGTFYVARASIDGRKPSVHELIS